MRLPPLKGKKQPALSAKDRCFVAELESLLNRYSKETPSNTPDFVLANYLVWCLEAFDVTMAYREQWHNPPKRRFAKKKKTRVRK